MGKKRKHDGEQSGRDLKPKHLILLHIRTNEKRLIVILENAQLETVKVPSQVTLIYNNNNSFSHLAQQELKN